MSQSSSETYWYVHYQGQKLGPYRWVQVARYYADCGSPADFLVWTSTMTDWLRFAAVTPSAPTPAIPMAASPAAAFEGEGEGGLRVVESSDDFSLSFQLRDSLKADPPGKAGAQPTKDAVLRAQPAAKPTQPVQQPQARVVSYDPQKANEQPAKPQPPAPKPAAKGDDGWLNMAQRSAKAPPESEPDKPLAQELNFDMPEVRHSPPVWVTLLLAIGCGVTFTLYKSAPALPVPKGPFTLQCGYTVDSGSGSSLRRRLRAHVAGEKFRVDTPHRQEDFAIYDGHKLQLFTRVRGRANPKVNLMENPNPLLMREIEVWKPRNRGEAMPTRRTAGRFAKRLESSEKTGAITTKTVEIIDAVQGVVLGRTETIYDRGKKLEQRQLTCRSVWYGPLTKGVFKP